MKDWFTKFWQEYYLKAGKENHYRAAEKHAEILDDQGNHSKSLKRKSFLMILQTVNIQLFGRVI